MSNYTHELDFAKRAALLAGQNALRMQTAGLKPEAKADESPVTAADRENERLLCEMIRAEWSADGVLGEEGARTTGHSGRRWIIDPIDGTRDFVRGNRLWCVLIALENQGESVVGVAHFPVLNETYWAVRGEGAFRDGRRLRVSSVSQLRDAVVSLNGMHAMSGESYASRVMSFLGRTWAVRSLGGAMDACMLAAGQMDIWLERKAEPWDVAPLQVIVEEAGARFFAVDGSRRFDAGSAVAFTPGLEKEVREFLGL